jgi:hypothetical protein
MKNNMLNQLKIMLSASIPSHLENTFKGQEMYHIIMVLTRRIISAGGKIVFGGHPSITPLIRNAALSVEGSPDDIHLFQLKRFKDKAPDAIHDKNIFSNIRWFGDGNTETNLASELSEMRRAMAESADAAIFIGGKTSDSLTETPGIREEYQVFMENHPNGPAYLIGMMEGETLNMIKEFENHQKKIPNRLSNDQLDYMHHKDNIELIAPMIVSDIAG